MKFIIQIQTHLPISLSLTFIQFNPIIIQVSLSLYLFHRLKYVKLGEFVFYFFWAFFFNVNFWFMNEIVLILGSFVADVVISVKVIGCMEASFMFSFYFVFSGMSLISMGLYFWLIFWFFFSYWIESCSINYWKNFKGCDYSCLCGFLLLNMNNAVCNYFRK